MADIDMNKLIGNNTYQIKIVPPAKAFSYIQGLTSQFVITGFLTNQLTWSGSNQFEGLHSGFRPLKAMEADMVKAETVANEVGVNTGDGQHAMMGITETIARWTGASKPTFGFNVMFVEMAPKDNIIDMVKVLIRGTLPHENSGTILKGTMMAPYGYKTGITGEDEQEPDEAEDYWANTKIDGVWRVQVGRWFNAPKLVLNSVGVNFSQQCSPSGRPLFAEAQLQFETVRLPKANELERFFRGVDLGGLVGD